MWGSGSYCVPQRPRPGNEKPRTDRHTDTKHDATGRTTRDDARTRPSQPTGTGAQPPAKPPGQRRAGQGTDTRPRRTEHRRGPEQPGARREPNEAPLEHHQRSDRHQPDGLLPRRALLRLPCVTVDRRAAKLYRSDGAPKKRSSGPSCTATRWVGGSLDTHRALGADSTRVREDGSCRVRCRSLSQSLR